MDALSGGFLPAEEVFCAACHRPVADRETHMKFMAGFGRRSGRFHLACVPPDFEAWLASEDERLLSAPPKRSGTR